MRYLWIIAVLAATLVAPVAQASLTGACCRSSTPASDDCCQVAQTQVSSCCHANTAHTTAHQSCSIVASSCGCDAERPALALIMSVPVAPVTTAPAEQEPILPQQPTAPMAQLGWDSWRYARPPPSLQALYCSYLI